MSLVAYLQSHLLLEEREQHPLIVLARLSASHPVVEDAVLVAKQSVSSHQLADLTAEYYRQAECEIKDEGHLSFLWRVFKEGKEIAIVAVTNFSHTSTRQIMVTVTPTDRREYLGIIDS